MKIIGLNDNYTFPAGVRTVVTVGNFDGVHLGHTRLVSRAVSLAGERGAASAAVTFVPHTRSVVYPELSTMLLTTFDEKASILAEMGVNYLFCVDFDEDFRRMTQEDFVKNILADRLRASDWVMGEGHHVGENSGGVKKNLQFACAKYHISMLAESLEFTGGAAISSTRIRGLITEGRMEEAASMLGRPYLIAAERAAGVKVATKLGYPTLNFKRPEAGKVIPPAGVYAAEIEISGDGEGRGVTDRGAYGNNIAAESRRLRGALYYGECPTFTGREAHFEFHALKFGGAEREPELGESVNLWLRKYIRPDAAFSSESELKSRIAQDIVEIDKIFT